MMTLADSADAAQSAALEPAAFLATALWLIVMFAAVLPREYFTSSAVPGAQTLVPVATYTCCDAQ